MSFWNEIKRMSVASKTKDIPSWQEFQASLTPENAYDKLVEYNESSNVKEWLNHGFEHETIDWLMNSFRFAAVAVSKDRVVDMVDYMNRCEVFNKIAPHEYKSGDMLTIFDAFFEKCDPAQCPRLLMALESNGHMQNMIKEGAIAGHSAARFYYDKVIGALSVQDAKAILSRSPSFQLAKRNSYFAAKTIEEYPNFKDLL